MNIVYLCVSSLCKEDFFYGKKRKKKLGFEKAGIYRSVGGFGGGRIFLGPVAGGIVGGIGDLIGWLIQPAGPFNIFITLGSIMLGVIPGLVFKFRMPPLIKIFISFVIIFVVCTAGLNSFGIWFYYVKGKGFFVFMAGRLATQSIVWAVNLALTSAIYYPVARYIFKIPDERRKPEKAESNVSGKESVLHR